jgi:hypothetical protein
MTKRPREDMRPGAKTCPHCGDEVKAYWSSHLNAIMKRCSKCRCRWHTDGRHVVAGRNCPLQQLMPLNA